MTRGRQDLGTRSRLRKLGADLGTTALAAAATALALDASRWSLVLLALALAAATGRAVTMRRRSPRLNLLTSQLGQRALIGASAAAALALLRPDHALGAALGGAVLVAAVLYEPYLRPGADVKVPVVAHLPGVRTTPVPADLSRQVLLADLGATAAGLVLATLGVSPWCWVPLAVLAAATRVRVSRDNARRAAALRRHERDLPGAVAALEPELALYTSWPGADGVHQVTMWLPYLQRTGRRCLVITRSSASARALADLVDVPVVEARGPADLDVIVTPSLRAAFYPNASSGNGVLVRYQQLTHVFLGHGDSDKPTSYNPTHAMYDRIFCAGEAAVRRYGEHGITIPDEKFVVVGRPQVEAIADRRAADRRAARPSCSTPPPGAGTSRRPRCRRWPSARASSAALLEAGATVVFRPHPFSRGFREDAALVERIQQLLAEDRGRTGRPHLWGPAAETERGVVDCFNLSDALVSDVSSVVSDYLFSGKPYAMVAVPGDPERFRASYPVARAAYVVPADLDGLAPTLRTMLGDDPLAAGAAGAARRLPRPLPQPRATRRPSSTRSRPSPGAERLRTDSDETGDETFDGTSAAAADEGPVARRDPGGPPAHRRSAAPRSRSRKRLKKLQRRLAQPRRWSQGAAVLVAAHARRRPGRRSGPRGRAVSASPRWPPLLTTVRPTLRRRKRWHRLLGEARGARVVLLSRRRRRGARRRGCRRRRPLVVLVLLTCVVVGEAAVQRAWGRLGLQVRNFPAHAHPGRGGRAAGRSRWPAPPPCCWSWSPTSCRAVAGARRRRARPARPLRGRAGAGPRPGGPPGGGRAPAARGADGPGPRVRGLLRRHRRGRLPGGHVGALLRPDRPALRRGHPLAGHPRRDQPGAQPARRRRPGDPPAHAHQPAGRPRALPDHRVLRQQRRPEHPLHRAPRADPRLAQPRRLREARLLQPGARHLRPDLHRGPGRRRPLRAARRAHPAGEVPRRRPPAGGEHRAGAGAGQHRRAAAPCCTRPPGRAPTPTPGCSPCRWRCRSSSTCWPPGCA